MGCSSARLLVQTPLSDANTVANMNVNNPHNPSPGTVATSNETSPINVATDTINAATRMHLTGVDLVVERNGSYTLLLTPKTHKQLMPYVLRKKRFRILVDKPRSQGTSTINSQIESYDLPNSDKSMESGKELKLIGKKDKKGKHKMESNIESVQQVATEELEKAKARFIGGRSIDRGDPDDENENIQSDDEGMIEEIVTTVEEDKDLECKVKKKIETKKTIAEDPETHNKITKVVKTEVTEITRTITINDPQDLERAKRELGIDDVNKLLPSVQVVYNLPHACQTTSTWIDHPRLTHVQETYYEPANEIVTSGDFPSDSPVKQHSPANDASTTETKQEQTLADATTVGRGPVFETMSPSVNTSASQQESTTKANDSEKKKTETKTKKKKSSLNLCSCTRSTANDIDEEQRKQKAATIIEQKSKQKKKASATTTNAILTSTNQQNETNVQSSIDINIQGQQLISSDVKQLITDKKSLIIDYIHSKVFVPSNLFTTNDQDAKGRKVSSRLLDLLNNDRCSSWTNLNDQLKDEYAEQLPSNLFIQPMVKTYEDLFTNKQSSLLNTFSTIQNEKDIKNVSENTDYITVVQTYINERDNQPTIDVITKPFVEKMEETLERLQQHSQSNEKVIDVDHEKQALSLQSTKLDMSDDTDKNTPIYNEEHVTKVLADVSPDKPITLAEAIAYQRIDLDDPKLGLSDDTIQRIKNLFRPLSADDEAAINLIRIKRSGKHLTDFNLSETNSFEKFHLSEPFIYQLQQSFEPTLDFNEKQFRSLTEAILNNKDEYSNLQFDIGKTSVPAGDMKESSTNDFSQSDSGYSMTTVTCESLASKVKHEFETINEPTSDQSTELEKNIDQTVISSDSLLDNAKQDDVKTEIAEQTKDNLDKNQDIQTVSNVTVVTKEESTKKTASTKKRKSGLFSCFGSKKAKASTEQRGQPTIPQTTQEVNNQMNAEKTDNTNQEKPVIDYATLPDGKRIYIDAYRERPGLDMSYKPKDFEARFTLPIAKPSQENEQPPTSDNVEQQLTTTTETVKVLEETSPLHLEVQTATDESVNTSEKVTVELEDAQPKFEATETEQKKVEESSTIEQEPLLTNVENVAIQKETVEEKVDIHFEPQSPVIEPVDVPNESTTVIIPSLKVEEISELNVLTNLHGAPVNLPEVELVTPGPLPTLTVTKEKQVKTKQPKTTEKSTKVKKSTTGLCASCFGAKAAANKTKKGKTGETTQAPIEQKKTIEEPTKDIEVTKANIENEKKEEPSADTILITPAPTVTTPTVENSPTPVLPLTTDDSITAPSINIDQFQERSFAKQIEETPKLTEHVDVSVENVVSVEEPHYQLPSSEPVPQLFTQNEYAVPEVNTYDVPRSIETPSVENIQIETTEKIIEHEPLLVSAMPDIEKPKEDLIETQEKIQSIITTETDTMPKVDVKETSTKGSYKLPDKKTKKKEKVKEPKVKKIKVKSEKKSGVLSMLLCHSNRKPKAPALNLPSVERDLTPNVETNQTITIDNDPLHVPNIDLPKPDISLPDYERPEVNMTTGKLSESSEFTVPVVDLPTIPNVQLPKSDIQAVESNISLTKVPNIELPELKLTSDEQETVKLPEIHLKSEKIELPEYDVKIEKVDVSLPTINNDIELKVPEYPIPDVQIDDKTISIDTDHEVKVDTTIPELPKFSADSAELPIKAELLPTEQKYTIADTHFVQVPDLSLKIDKPISETIEISKVPELDFQLPSLEPVTMVPSDTNSSPPSFEDKTTPILSTVIPAVEISATPIKSPEKQVIETKPITKKKSSTLPLCSCFGKKSAAQKDKTKTIKAPKADLPKVDAPIPSSNISTTLKTEDALHAPSTDLPPLDLKLPSPEQVRLSAIHFPEKKRQAPKVPTVNEEEKLTITPEATVSTAMATITNGIDVPQINIVSTTEIKTEIEPLVIENKAQDVEVIRTPTPPPVILPPAVEEIKVEPTVSTIDIKLQPTEHTQEIHVESKKLPSFEMKAPAFDIPQLDLVAPSKTDAYIALTKPSQSSTTITASSHSDSGLEAIISSHMHPSSTFDTNQTIDDQIHQQTSMSSGFGSTTLDSVQSKVSTTISIEHDKPHSEPKRENSLLKHDFTRKITMNDDLRAKLLFQQSQLKTCLETEISSSIEDFDSKKDHKSLDKILTHGIDLVKDKKVTTYPELKQKLIVEHKNEAFIVDPVVRSLYCAIEKQSLENIEKPEFALAIRDMVRLPAKQTIETVTKLNKEIKEEPHHDTERQSSTRSCLTCGRSKGKQKESPSSTTTTKAATSTGLLDERRRAQLNTHRNELNRVLRDHIQSSQPPIRQFGEHPKEVDKIIQKSLSLVPQSKTISYDQIRNDLKTEYKQTFYVVDPIVDIVRDTFDHCDIAQMNDQTNLNILDSNITQTANLYNQMTSATNILTPEEYNRLKSNQLTWLNAYLVNKELTDKKTTAKHTKELNRILNRSLEILSLNVVYTWDELNLQLRREFPKAHNLCDRAIEILKQSQKDGLLLLGQSPDSAQQDVTTVNIITTNGKRRASTLLTDRARQNLKANRKKIISSITNLISEHNKALYNTNQIESFVGKTFSQLEGQKSGQFKDYNDLKEKMNKDSKRNHEKLIEQIVDVIEQAHAANQFDDIDKLEVQTLMKDRLNGKPLVLKEMYVSLPPRAGAFATSKHSHDDSSRFLSTSADGDHTMNSSTSSHRVARGLSWREANERARILFYRGKHPAIHYDEQAAAFDVRMLLETTTGGTQEIPVSDSDVHELLNSCGVQWDGVNIISLVDHSEDVVRAAEQAALRVIRERGLVDLRTPPSTKNTDDNDEPTLS